MNPEQTAANENNLATGCYHTLVVSSPSSVQAVGMPGMEWGGDNVLGSFPWNSQFKVSVIFFLSFSFISKLIELISYTCFTHIFVCWLLWASSGFSQPSKIDLSSSQLLVNRFCVWLGGFSWELFKLSSCLLFSGFQEQDFVQA